MKARQAGKVSTARYIMKTQPSWEKAWYTVKMLVAVKWKFQRITFYLQEIRMKDFTDFIEAIKS
jgi:hypothetical protein